VDHLFGRLIAFALVALLLLAPGRALAEPSSLCGINNNCDQGMAYGDAQTDIVAIYAERDTCKANSCGSTSYMQTCSTTSGNYTWTVPAVNGPVTNSTNGLYQDYRVMCPNNTTVARRFTYKATSTCSARNATLGDVHRVYESLPSCVAGCGMTHGATVTTTFAGATLINTDNTQYSGTICSDTTPVTPTSAALDHSDKCKPAGNGQTMCVKPNGDQCAMTSKGHEFCWPSNGQGEAVNSDELNKRKLGAGPSPPITAPPGSTPYTFDGGFTSSVTNNSTAITNIYNTSTWTSGTPSNPTPTTTTPTGTQQTPGDTGSVSGGSCATNYTCTGTAVECALLQEENKTRCAAQKAVEYTKGETCDAGDVPVCSGEQCDAVSYSGALQAWKTRCSVEALSKVFSGSDVDPLARGDDGMPVSGEAAGLVQDHTYGTDGLDTTGRGAPDECPEAPDVEVMGHTIHFDSSKFCEWMQLGGQLVLLAAALVSLKILGGST
jgi:hypothetical protein